MAGQRIKPFEKINTESEELNRVQDKIENALAQLMRTDILDGRLLININLDAGANSIEHKLNRNLRGWIITRKRSTADIWDEQDNNSRPGLFLNLQASTAVTVDLWVF